VGVGKKTKKRHQIATKGSPVGPFAIWKKNKGKIHRKGGGERKRTQKAIKVKHGNIQVGKKNRGGGFSKTGCPLAGGTVVEVPMAAQGGAKQNQFFLQKC